MVLNMLKILARPSLTSTVQVFLSFHYFSFRISVITLRVKTPVVKGTGAFNNILTLTTTDSVLTFSVSRAAFVERRVGQVPIRVVDVRERVFIRAWN